VTCFVGTTIAADDFVCPLVEVSRLSRVSVFEVQCKADMLGCLLVVGSKVAVVIFSAKDVSFTTGGEVSAAVCEVSGAGVDAVVAVQVVTVEGIIFAVDMDDTVVFTCIVVDIAATTAFAVDVTDCSIVEFTSATFEGERGIIVVSLADSGKVVLLVVLALVSSAVLCLAGNVRVAIVEAPSVTSGNEVSSAVIEASASGAFVDVFWKSAVIVIEGVISTAADVDEFFVTACFAVDVVVSAWTAAVVIDSMASAAIELEAGVMDVTFLVKVFSAIDELVDTVTLA
jgi:hypothetical protein